MSGIFISYRRGDTGEIAHRLHDALGERFGAAFVFIDVVDIDAGEDFGAVIDEKVGFCDVVLAVIGKAWSSSADASGRRRLDDPNDWVRLEIGVALARDIRVVPLLVDGALLPATSELPPPLAALPERQALPLRDREFMDDVERLGATLQRLGVGRTDVSWLSLITKRHRALDPLDLGRPEVIGRALRFLLIMTTLDQIFHLLAAPEVGPKYWRLVRVVGAAVADAGGWLTLGVMLHFAMRAVGGRATLGRSVAVTCFLSAFLPLIGLAQAPVWGLNISVTADLSEPSFSPSQIADRMVAFTKSLGSFALARVAVSLVVATTLWALVLSALFQALRTLHRLRAGPALAAATAGSIAYLAFLMFVWTPLLGTFYTALATSTRRP